MTVPTVTRKPRMHGLPPHHRRIECNAIRILHIIPPRSKAVNR